MYVVINKKLSMRSASFLNLILLSKNSCFTGIQQEKVKTCFSCQNELDKFAEPLKEKKPFPPL